MIPSAVSKIFEEYQRSYESKLQECAPPDLVPRADVPSEQVIKMSLLGDELGRMQVLFPANCMLDVDRLNLALGRSLKAVPSNEVSSLTTQYSVAELPAIPDITGLPSVIDNRILAFEEVYVDEGDKNSLIRLNRDYFTLTIRKSKEASFAVPLAEIGYPESTRDGDEQHINKAIEQFTSLRIKRRLEDTLELPPLPQSAQEIIRLRSKPDADVGELASIIERDPSLSAQVVSWASSSFYNAPGKIKSVHDAIVRVLGFDMVMNLSMGLSLGKSLSVPDDTPDGYTPYWHQAMWTAIATTSLISKMEPSYRPSFGLSYLSGLLHNFGYLVMAHIFPPHQTLICRYMEANPHVDPSVIEYHLLGITKEQINSQLMTVWNMPEEVTEALRYQKLPNYEGEQAEYANLLCLTSHLLRKYGALKGGQYLLSDADEARLLDQFGLDAEQVEDALEKLVEGSAEIEATAAMMSR